LDFQLCEEHESVEDSRRKQKEPINLDTCLQAFTKEEELGEDELYYCSKCKKHCLASKKLDIWRLPPILVSQCLILCSDWGRDFGTF
jgi:ubiquitin carboxyl-terminal hydrolase 6/32